MLLKFHYLIIFVGPHNSINFSCVVREGIIVNPTLISSYF